MRPLGRTAGALALLAAASAMATPPQMMTNVYRLTEAAAVLQACFDSAEFPKLPAERAAALQGQMKRIGGLVNAIGRHYGDASLDETFEATRRRIAGEAFMREYSKGKYRHCGEALGPDMERYVAENEKLIQGYFASQRKGGK